jgi:hypothetical protein
MLSNRALKLPSPKPSVALALDELEEDRAELVLAEDLQQQLAGGAVDQDVARRRPARSSPWPGMRLSTSS